MANKRRIGKKPEKKVISRVLSGINTCYICPYATDTDDNFDPGYDCTYGSIVKVKPLHNFPELPEDCPLPVDPLDVLWRYLDQDDRKRWMMLPVSIRRTLIEFRKNPVSLLKKGKEEGWLK